jgi:hypothetical protein
MSFIQGQQQEQDECIDHPCKGIDLLIRPGKKDLGGFTVRRCLPHPQRRLVGPWIFFDHAGPSQLPAGEGVDVRPHPHINLATVTYMFEGQFQHKDSLGNDLAIQPGDINLMVAGKGIVHSERSPDSEREKDATLHALQLWLALPEQDQEIDPAFYHYEAEEIPQVDFDGIPIRVMMGHAFGVSSPVKTFADTLYLESRLQPGQSLPLPETEERAVYVAEGEVEIDGETVPEHAMAVLTSKQGLAAKANKASKIALIGGENVGERHIWWNFVSTSKDRIEQAKQDWQAGNFPTVPGDDEEFIPLPEK